MECGHGGICFECGISIWKESGQCHLCRELISQVLRIHLQPGVEHVEVIESARMQEGDVVITVDKEAFSRRESESFIEAAHNNSA
jgi:hypothetical protein